MVSHYRSVTKGRRDAGGETLEPMMTMMTTMMMMMMLLMMTMATMISMIMIVMIVSFPFEGDLSNPVYIRCNKKLKLNCSEHILSAIEQNNETATKQRLTEVRHL